METTRIKIKIGSAEFDGEGPVDLIQEQFRVFMEAVAKQPSTEIEAKTAVKENPAVEVKALKLSTPNPLTLSELASVYRDDGTLLSLIAIPKGDTAKVDGLLMLVYGYELLKEQPTVTAGTLMLAARQSGLGIERIDRTMIAKEDLFNTAGVKKGRKYTLNNKGKLYVTELIRGLL
jgi:hypothetical protein